MKAHSAAAVAVATTASAVALAVPAPALAQPIDQGRIHDAFTTDVYDCNGTPAQDTIDIHVNFLLNQRGSSPFPYYRESLRGTAVTENLNTGGTYTQVFTTNSMDHAITDNGDGTITISGQNAGGFRTYDQFGTLVLLDPGNFRYAFDIDYNGTPGDPSDDAFVDGSFRVIRDSTGRNDIVGRDFCEDLVLFTS